MPDQGEGLVLPIKGEKIRVLFPGQPPSGQAGLQLCPPSKRYPDQNLHEEQNRKVENSGS